MNRELLNKWPENWPPPDAFLGSLLPTIISLHYISTLTEHEIVVRFKNRYGVKISRSFIHNSMYLVNILKFSQKNLNNYVIVHDSDFPELTWCFKSDEILKICEKVARWDNKSAHAQNSFYRKIPPAETR